MFKVAGAKVLHATVYGCSIFPIEKVSLSPCFTGAIVLFSSSLAQSQSLSFVSPGSTEIVTAESFL